jgi:hypothetical protein
LSDVIIIPVTFQIYFNSINVEPLLIECLLEKKLNRVLIIQSTNIHIQKQFQQMKNFNLIIRNLNSKDEPSKKSQKFPSKVEPKINPSGGKNPIKKESSQSRQKKVLKANSSSSMSRYQHPEMFFEDEKIDLISFYSKGKN